MEEGGRCSPGFAVQEGTGEWIGSGPLVSLAVLGGKWEVTKGRSAAVQVKWDRQGGGAGF